MTPNLPLLDPIEVPVEHCSVTACQAYQTGFMRGQIRFAWLQARGRELDVSIPPEFQHVPEFENAWTHGCAAGYEYALKHYETGEDPFHMYPKHAQQVEGWKLSLWTVFVLAALIFIVLLLTGCETDWRKKEWKAPKIKESDTVQPTEKQSEEAWGTLLPPPKTAEAKTAEHYFKPILSATGVPGDSGEAKPLSVAERVGGSERTGVEVARSSPPPMNRAVHGPKPADIPGGTWTQDPRYAGTALDGTEWIWCKDGQ